MKYKLIQKGKPGDPDAPEEMVCYPYKKRNYYPEKFSPTDFGSFLFNERRCEQCYSELIRVTAPRID